MHRQQGDLISFLTRIRKDAQAAGYYYYTLLQADSSVIS
jgi:hypothetical protein